VRRSQNSLTALAVLSVAVLTQGCGAMINGMTQTIEIRTADPKAQILKDGTVVGTGTATVGGSPSVPPVVYVQDATGNVTRFQAESSVSVTAVALDILWSLTIVGVAAPISDAMLGTFSGLDDPEEPIVVERSARRARTIQYANYASSLVE